VHSAEEAMAALEGGGCDCVSSTWSCRATTGSTWSSASRPRSVTRILPIVVYTGKELTELEEQRLKKYTQSIILKSGVHSPERLLNDTALFLHRIEERLPERSRSMISESRKVESAIAGRKVLVIDDDVRNIFA